MRPNEGVETQESVLRVSRCDLSLVVKVGARGFEPPTSASRTLRAATLRYAPLCVLL